MKVYKHVYIVKQWTVKMTEGGDDGRRQAGNHSTTLKLVKEHFQC